MAGVSGAAGTQSFAAAGTISTLVVTNQVKAELGEGVTVTVGSETLTDEAGDLTVDADDDTHIFLFAGALAVSTSTGAGATIVAMVINKQVEALAEKLGTVTVNGNVTVSANSVDKVYLLALAFAGGGNMGIAGDVNVLVFQSTTKALLGTASTLKTSGKVDVLANADSTLVHIGAGVAVGGSTGAVAVAVVTYFYNHTNVN